MWWATPNGGYRSVIEARIMKGLGVVPGIPDIFLLYRSRLHGLELKAEGGRLSPAQVSAHDKLREAGAIIEVATGIDEAIDTLERWDMLRGRMT
jgi:hypothetical protein